MCAPFAYLDAPTFLKATVFKQIVLALFLAHCVESIKVSFYAFALVFTKLAVPLNVITAHKRKLLSFSARKVLICDLHLNCRDGRGVIRTTTFT